MMMMDQAKEMESRLESLYDGDWSRNETALPSSSGTSSPFCAVFCVLDMSSPGAESGPTRGVKLSSSQFRLPDTAPLGL